MLGLERKADRLQKALDELKITINKLQPISVEQAEKCLFSKSIGYGKSLVYVERLSCSVIINLLVISSETMARMPLFSEK